MNIAPNALAAGAACFVYPRDVEAAVTIYLLQQLAGNTQTPAQLAASAACFIGMPQDVRDSVKVYLLAQAATAAGA